LFPLRPTGAEKEKVVERKNKMTVSRMQDEIKYHLTKLFHGLENILLPIFLFFAPMKGILITVGAFIILDTLFGVWKSRVTKVPITSRALSGVISKMLLYQAAIISAYLLDYYIIGDILESVFGIEGLLVKTAALLLIFIETQSINENYKIAKGIDLWQQFKKMLRRAKEVTTEVTGITKDLEEIKSSVGDVVKEEDLDEVFKDFD
jgi:hypothetical protein